MASKKEITDHKGRTQRKRGPKFKLTPGQCEAMKAEYDLGSEPVNQIADRYGVTQQTVYNILHRLRGNKKVTPRKTTTKAHHRPSTGDALDGWWRILDSWGRDYRRKLDLRTARESTGTPAYDLYCAGLVEEAFRQCFCRQIGESVLLRELAKHKRRGERWATFKKCDPEEANLLYQRFMEILQEVINEAEPFVQPTGLVDVERGWPSLMEGAPSRTKDKRSRRMLGGSPRSSSQVAVQ